MSKKNGPPPADSWFLRGGGIFLGKFFSIIFFVRHKNWNLVAESDSFQYSVAVGALPTLWDPEKKIRAIFSFESNISILPLNFREKTVNIGTCWFLKIDLTFSFLMISIFCNLYPIWVWFDWRKSQILGEKRKNGIFRSIFRFFHKFTMFDPNCQFWPI